MVVQTADGKNSFPDTSEIVHHRAAARRIGNRSDDIVRFIKKEIAERLGFDHLTECFDFIFSRICFTPQFRNCPSVHADFSYLNQLFRFSAGADTCSA